MKRDILKIILMTSILMLSGCAEKPVEQAETSTVIETSQEMAETETESTKVQEEETEAVETTSSYLSQLPEELLDELEAKGRDYSVYEEMPYDYYAVATRFDAIDVENFALDAKEAVLAKDWAYLSEMIQYPIEIDGTMFESAEEFLALDLSNNVQETFIENIGNGTYHEIAHDENGIVIGDGNEILFSDISVDENTYVMKILKISGMLK